MMGLYRPWYHPPLVVTDIQTYLMVELYSPWYHPPLVTDIQTYLVMGLYMPWYTVGTTHPLFRQMWQISATCHAV